MLADLVSYSAIAGCLRISLIFLCGRDWSQKVPTGKTKEKRARIFFLGGEGGVGCKVSTKFAAKTVLGLEGERIKKLSEYCILSTGKEEEDGAV